MDDASARDMTAEAAPASTILREVVGMFQPPPPATPPRQTRMPPTGPVTTPCCTGRGLSDAQSHAAGARP